MQKCTHLFLISIDAHLEYVLVSNPLPKRVPPKYLTTTIKVLSKLFLLITSKIGSPAVLEGSLSSFFLSITPIL